MSLIPMVHIDQKAYSRLANSVENSKGFQTTVKTVNGIANVCFPTVSLMHKKSKNIENLASTRFGKRSLKVLRGAVLLGSAGASVALRANPVVFGVNLASSAYSYCSDIRDGVLASESEKEESL